jgi:predicted O-methyltransferase YrrM
MEITNEEIQHYAEKHSTAESELLKRINRETHARVLMPRMLSGHLQGRVLAMISKLVQPRWVLEIGTYTGYSSLCLAEGLREDGTIITMDINEELETQTRKYFKEAGLNSKIDYRIGNATSIIPSIEQTFDLVFIDADKESYSFYFDLIIDKVRPGGIILADNVLWSGKVLDEKPDKDTRAILAFNKKVHEDPRVECVLLPLRDGIFVIRKVSL